MSGTQAQTWPRATATWNPTTTGTVTFRLTNSWNYDAGTYLQTFTFTLSTPEERVAPDAATTLDRGRGARAATGRGTDVS